MPDQTAPSSERRTRRRSVRARVRRFLQKRTVWGVFGFACLAGAVTHGTMGCEGWDASEPFTRISPEVDRALAQLDAGDPRTAEQILGEYLNTGVCQGSKIGIPESVKQKPDGTFDLGLILFYLGERYGRKFGDEEKGDPAKPDEPAEIQRRSEEIDCALLVLQAISGAKETPIELRARASYLAGNLEFLRRRYEDAVRFYDQALRLVPGVVEEAGGDAIGRDTAWNRAIALRRLQDEKNDAGADGGQDADADGADGDDGADGNESGDADADGAPDAPDGDAGGGDAGDGGDGGQDAGDASPGNDAGDAGDGGPADAGQDGSPQESPDAGEQDAGGAPPDEEPTQPPMIRPLPEEEGPQQELEEDDKLLDEYDHGTPTYQQEEAKRRGTQRRTTEDK